MRPMLIVACIALASGCATYVNPAYFRPAERVVSTTPTREKEALYDLVMPDGHPGEAKVWSNGVDRGNVDGTDVTLVHVALEVKNASNAPIHLEVSSLELRDLRLAKGAAVTATLAGTAGDPTIPEGSVRRTDGFFRLPEVVLPPNVRSFWLRWNLRCDDKEYAQLTPFTIDPDLGIRLVSNGKRLVPTDVIRRHKRVVIVESQVRQY
jgi:hypothetical protein